MLIDLFNEFVSFVECPPDRIGIDAGERITVEAQIRLVFSTV